MHYFTADTHFNHTNIIRYCRRPFSCTEEMDDTIINNINLFVKEEDTLWHLGDFCFGGHDAVKFLKKAEDYRNRIKCDNVILIWGNHDPDPFSHKKEWRIAAEGFKRLFSETYHLRNTRIKEQAITLCHYALKTWDKAYHGSWHLFGHSHGTLPDDRFSLSFDIGVDCHDFKPLSFNQVSAIIAEKVTNKQMVQIL